jgi:hypothetical protein
VRSINGGCLQHLSLFFESFLFFLSNLPFLLLLLLDLRPLLFFDLCLFILKLLLFFFDLIDLIKNNLETLVKHEDKLRVILHVKLNQSTLGGIPSLAGIISFLVFFEKISHFSLNRLFAAIWKTLIEIIDDLLLALK